MKAGKKILLAALLLLPLPAGAQRLAVSSGPGSAAGSSVQEGARIRKEEASAPERAHALDEGRLTSYSSIEADRAKTLWFASGNTAGLSLRPLSAYNTVSFKYDRESGNLHLMQEGQSSDIFGFDTQGASNVGKFRLWGHFSYDNITEDGTRFNTVLYDPFDERKLYGVADTVLSSWKRQRYLMEFKAALPIAGDRLHAGLHMVYSDGMAAKQNDPRAESYRYFITLKPSAIYRFSFGTIGLNGYYSHDFERSVPTLSNGSEPQNVFILKGLGNFTKETVGSGGLGTMYYRVHSYGGSLQYGMEFSGFSLLAEAGITMHSTGVVQSPTKPLIMGDTQATDIDASIDLLFGSSIVHRAGLSFNSRSTDGVESTSVWSSSSGRWEVRSSAVMSTYSTMQAGASYDGFLMEGRDCRWKWHADLVWISKQDEYTLPNSVFEYGNIALNGGAVRNFIFGKSALSAGLSAGYRKNLSSAYTYSGSRASDAPAAQWYPHDLMIVSSDYLLGALSLGYSGNLGQGMTLCFRGELTLLHASRDLQRIHPTLGATLIF